MPVTDLSILLEVSHATHFHTKKEQYVFRRIYIFPGDGAMKTLWEVICQPGDRIGVPGPTYAMYYVYSKIFNTNLYHGI